MRHDNPATARREYLQWMTRRCFLSQCQVGLGSIALAGLMGQSANTAQAKGPFGPKLPPLTPRVRRVVYLHMAGGPSQLDLFDFKPALRQRDGQRCPDSCLENQQFAFIKGHPKLLGPPHGFVRHGDAEVWISELLPHMGSIIDNLTVVRSMTTDQFNHAPAQLLLHTGNPRIGYPCLGSWVAYGLGTENQDLPAFVVLVSGGRIPAAGKQLWGAGFLPGVYQGVQCRNTGDPILFVTNPAGMSAQVRRQSLDVIQDLNRRQAELFGDPDTITRIEQFELAYRMQTSVPEVMDIAAEPDYFLSLYGAEPGASSFANNCLLARRLIEHGVRFVQLYDWGWDEHGTGKHDDLMTQLPLKCRQTDRATAALIVDLKQRGLLDDTLIIWGGEFGRTSMMEARNGSTFLGRDHHPHCFTMLFAGAGLKRGAFGATDDLGYFVTEGQVTIRDLQATILHLLGFDPFRFSYPFQGLNARLIGPTDEAQIASHLLA